MNLAVIVIIAAAAYRAARLVATDTLTDELRGVIYRWAWDDPGSGIDPQPRRSWRTYVYGLVSCSHCVGVWAAAGAYLWWQYLGALRWAVVIAAIAGVQSFAVSLAERAE